MDYLVFVAACLVLYLYNVFAVFLDNDSWQYNTTSQPMSSRPQMPKH